jgi:hypothetical protein
MHKTVDLTVLRTPTGVSPKISSHNFSSPLPCNTFKAQIVSIIACEYFKELHYTSNRESLTTQTTDKQDAQNCGSYRFTNSNRSLSKNIIT